VGAGEEIGAAAARLRKDLDALIETRRVRRFVGVIERPVRAAFRVAVGLLVALQVIPSREDHAAEAVDRRSEESRRSVIEQTQIAGRGLVAPEPGDGRRFLALVELRVEMPLAAARAVGGEEDA